MRHLTRSLLALSLTTSVALLPTPTHASPFSLPTIDAPAEAGGEDEDDEDDPQVIEAKNEYRAGSDAYALGNYEQAVAHFERAYELSQQPALLFNLGQSYTRWYDISNNVDHLKKARRLYENYVLNVGATQLDEQGQADARADAQRRIAEVDRRIAAHEQAEAGSGSGPIDDGGPGKKPVHKKAWFWLTIVGGLAAAGGIAAAVVLTTRRSAFTPELGTIGRAPLNGGLALRF